MLLPNGTKGESKFVLTPPILLSLKGRITGTQEIFNCFYQLTRKYSERKEKEIKYGIDM